MSRVVWKMTALVSRVENPHAPRRLVVIVAEVAGRETDHTRLTRGPKVSAAFGPGGALAGVVTKLRGEEHALARPAAGLHPANPLAARAVGR
jgi:glycyl-tRNA synthetase beta subunit